MQALTQMSYYLLVHPEYTEQLRQEIEAVVAKKGWTKAGQTPLAFYSISQHGY
jgi:hypothetical protein